MTIGFIGAGNMGSALIAGNLKHGLPPEQIVALELDAKKRAFITEHYGIRTLATLADAPALDILVLSVKPQHLQQTITQIKPYIQTRIIVSIAAGVPCKTLSSWLGNQYPIVRAMPNTPAMIGLGMTGLYSPDTLEHDIMEMVNSLFTAVGRTLWVNAEILIDAVTAISGSGPAYFFYMMEAMKNAGLQLGLAPADIDQLVQQTALGAAQLASSTATSFTSLRQQVTSKGGTTEAAITTLDQKTTNQVIIEAITAAYNRSVEMSKVP